MPSEHRIITDAMGEYAKGPFIKSTEHAALGAGNHVIGIALNSAEVGEDVTIALKNTQTVEYVQKLTPEDFALGFLSSLNAWADVEENHRLKTPARMVKMFREMTTREEFDFTTFPAKTQDMVTLGPIPFYSLCAHHTAPFFGNAFIGYVPEGRIAGLSKFPRAVKQIAKGFHVQEELTHEIANFIEDNLAPKGTAVVLRAEHLCMAMRGVQQPGVITTTSAMLGVFADHDRTAKAEFMNLISKEF
jgi:GTP cyclohydrolase IA